MTTVADLAAGASGAAAIVALALAFLALRAHRTTRSQRSLLLVLAFLVAFAQAVLTAWLLARAGPLDPPCLAVPGAHALMLVLMYVALLRV